MNGEYRDSIEFWWHHSGQLVCSAGFGECGEISQKSAERGGTFDRPPLLGQTDELRCVESCRQPRSFFEGGDLIPEAQRVNHDVEDSRYRGHLAGTDELGVEGHEASDPLGGLRCHIGNILDVDGSVKEGALLIGVTPPAEQCNVGHAESVSPTYPDAQK